MLQLLSMCPQGQGNQAVRLSRSARWALSSVVLTPRLSQSNRFSIRNMVEAAAIRDISDASVYQGAYSSSQAASVAATGTICSHSNLISQNTSYPSFTSESFTAFRALSTHTLSVLDLEKADATVLLPHACASTRVSLVLVAHFASKI